MTLQDHLDAYYRQWKQAMDRRDPDSRQAVAHLPVGDNLPRSLGEAIHWKERALKAEADRDEAQSALGYVLAHLKGVIRYVEEK